MKKRRFKLVVNEIGQSIMSTIPKWDLSGHPSGLISIPGIQNAEEITEQIIHYVE